MSPWDDPAVTERLKELIDDPALSYAKIAARLNDEFGLTLSRCACIGRARRRGFVMPAEKYKNLLVEREKDRLASGRINARRDKPTPPKRKTIVELFGVVSDNVKDLPAEQSPFAVTLFDARPDQCRWPVDPKDGVFLFCGDVKVPGYSYCSRHCLRAFDMSRTYARAA